MRVVSVVGARPQFIKLAPIASEFHRRGIEHVVIHTGQHYDSRMSGVFFDDFKLSEPSINLRVGSGSHGAQTGAILIGLEPLLVENTPDWVLVYGDTNSTIAAALASVKLGISLAHLEAGLRSFNRSMPEELNRVLTDHAADLLLAPTASAIAHLEDEGLGSRAVLVGDVMADVCLAVADQLAAASYADKLSLTRPYILATLHRPYNTDSSERLGKVIGALSDSPLPVVLPAHPRLLSKAKAFGISLDSGSLRVCEPLSYTEMVRAVSGARAVVTDSGGLQKEAYLLATPCTTLRPETEWVETLDSGWNQLCFERLADLSEVALRPIPTSDRPPIFGRGDAAERVAVALESRLPG